jgi:hypothetical protein
MTIRPAPALIRRDLLRASEGCAEDEQRHGVTGSPLSLATEIH